MRPRQGLRRRPVGAGTARTRRRCWRAGVDGRRTKGDRSRSVVCAIAGWMSDGRDIGPPAAVDEVGPQDGARATALRTRVVREQGAVPAMLDEGGLGGERRSSAGPTGLSSRSSGELVDGRGLSGPSNRPPSASLRGGEVLGRITGLMLTSARVSGRGRDEFEEAAEGVGQAHLLRGAAIRREQGRAGDDRGHAAGALHRRSRWPSSRSRSAPPVPGTCRPCPPAPRSAALPAVPRGARCRGPRRERRQASAVSGHPACLPRRHRCRAVHGSLIAQKGYRGWQ